MSGVLPWADVATVVASEGTVTSLPPDDGADAFTRAALTQIDVCLGGEALTVRSVVALLSTWNLT